MDRPTARRRVPNRPRTGPLNKPGTAMRRRQRLMTRRNRRFLPRRNRLARAQNNQNRNDLSCLRTIFNERILYDYAAMNEFYF